jgi:hypothetical protein
MSKFEQEAQLPIVDMTPCSSKRKHICCNKLWQWVAFSLNELCKIFVGFQGN